MNIFGIGIPEIAVIVVLALLIFGPKRLPQLGKTIGKTLKGLQTASKEFENEINKTLKLNENDEGIIILNQTPFYGESGGQVGDTGEIISGNFKFEITDVQKKLGDLFVHYGKVKSGSIKIKDNVEMKIDIDRLSQNVPKQEVGRLSYKELTLSRANRSVRAFNYVVECLSKGIQPNTNELSKVGYLYRTTAVYGSGKFGLADRFRIKNRDEINGPFRLEMMLVYLVRQFTFDQVNHIAKHKNPKDAVELDLDICRNLGIGNSTGLGMAPFIVNHPSLLNNWILAKETALKKIREIEKVSEEEFKIFYNCLTKSLKNVTSWNTDSEYQKKKINNLINDLQNLINYLKDNIHKSNFYIFKSLFLKFFAISFAALGPLAKS